LGGTTSRRSRSVRESIIGDLAVHLRSLAARDGRLFIGIPITNRPTPGVAPGPFLDRTGLIGDSLLGALRVDYACPTSEASHEITQRLHFGGGRF
jgi:hypothetical protein